jgi:hypothetical protein
MSEREQLLPDSARGISAYLRIQWNATEAAGQFAAVSKRPVRHNRAIERAALWHTLALDKDCARILETNSWSQLVRPKTGIVRSRYEAEAAIRTIPSLLPFSSAESGILHRNMGDGKDPKSFRFDYGI